MTNVELNRNDAGQVEVTDANFQERVLGSSQPVLVDQTPPRLTLSAARRNGDKVEIDVDAVDTGSAIRRAEYSVNGSEWRLLEAADGITDGRVERFTISVTANPNETSIVVRVFDSAGNPGLARTVVR